MVEELRNKWMQLYEFAWQIGDLDPWEIFDEGDKFAYIEKAKNKVLYFSFIAESAGRYGIACYDGVENYARARKRLTTPNNKLEPTFMLQSAYICLWGNREDLRKPTYELIKELGFSFRGKGAWLYFQRYETGYEPVIPSEQDLDFMIEALGNLYMMVRAVRDGSVDPQFDRGLTLVRWYEEEDSLYYTHSLQMPEPEVTQVEIRLQAGPLFGDLLKLPVRESTWNLDWSYLPTLVKDENGRWEFPLLLLCVDEKSGYVLFNHTIDRSQNIAKDVLVILCQNIEDFGKPIALAVCNDDLKACIEDLCRRLGIKLSVKKRLPAVAAVRKELIKML